MELRVLLWHLPLYPRRGRGSLRDNPGVPLARVVGGQFSEAHR
jgi:hypothetical protein